MDPLVASSFCSICKETFTGRAQSIGLTRPMDKLRKIHHPSVASLCNSKDQGCHLCSVLWDYFLGPSYKPFPEKPAGSTDGIFLTSAAAIVSFSETKKMNTLQFEDWYVPWYGGDTDSHHFRLANDSVSEVESVKYHGVQYMRNRQFLLELVPADIVDPRSLHDMGTSSRSVRSRSIVQRWFRNCVDHHQHGFPSTAETFFPNRVLDVGNIGDMIIKLRTSDPSDQINEQYATLSYCWGDANHLKLETKTLPQFQNGITVTKLPETMRNAVETVRDLGLRYLWVDSLCIIQNSKDDWRTQSAIMGSIYQHSQINIAATEPTNSEGGLFFDRTPFSILPLQVQTRFPFGDTEQPISLFNIVQQIPYIINIERAPLNSRGWVMQERLLARRTLHCARKQLYWECEHHFASESYPNGISLTLDRKPGEFYSTLREYMSPSQSIAAQPEAHIVWLRLVQQYTACKLTNEEDILIAISGLAKQWRNILSDEYIAGLWLSSLPLGLLWYGESVKISQLQNSKCETWRAPSWSWAGYKGTVTWSKLVVPPLPSPYNWTRDATLISVGAANIRAASGDSTGQLLQGSVAIQGVLMVGLTNSHGTSTQYDGMNSAITHGFKSREITLNTPHDEYKGVCCFDSDTKREEVDRKESLPHTCLPTILLRLTDQVPAQGYEPMSIVVEGILVQKVDSAGNPREWERVGYFSVWRKLKILDIWFEGLRDCDTGQIAKILEFGEVEDIILV